MEQLSLFLQKFATALPNTIIPANENLITCRDNYTSLKTTKRKKKNTCNLVQSITLKTLLINQQLFLPNEEALKYSHISKVL